MIDLEYDSEDETSTTLDTTWINEFEKIDKDYESFYIDDLNYVKISIIYVNKMNEISNIKEEKILLKTPNTLSREEIIGILKRNSILENKKFTIMTMLKYNFDLEPPEVRTFLMNSNDRDSTYLQVVKNVDEIKWEKTISMFQDLNNLLIIFYENSDFKSEKRNDKSKTKRIYLGSTTSLSSHNKTIKKN